MARLQPEPAQDGTSAHVESGSGSESPGLDRYVEGMAVPSLGSPHRAHPGDPSGGIGLWAPCKGYLHVKPEEGAPPRDLSALLPDKRVPLRAGGCFEAMHSQRDFADDQVVFSTLYSGEYVITAYIPRSRFLLLGQWPAGELGRWCNFCYLSPWARLLPDGLLLGFITGWPWGSAIGRTEKGNGEST